MISTIKRTIVDHNTDDEIRPLELQHHIDTEILPVNYAKIKQIQF